MAIVVTTKKINGIVYKYTYSDAGKMIQRDGVIYVDAVDPYGSDRVYTEVEEKVKEETVNTETIKEEENKKEDTIKEENEAANNPTEPSYYQMPEEHHPEN